MTEKPFSLAMMSALQAVARMKGDSAIAWPDLLDESATDDRHPPEATSQQGWKPAGR